MKNENSRANRLMAEAQAIHDLVEREGRDMTPEESEQFSLKVKEAKASMAREEELNSFDVWKKETAGRISNPAEQFDLPKQTQRHRYSLCRALKSAMQNHGSVKSGLEKEVSDEIALQYGKSPSGFYMPHRLNDVEQFVLNTTTGTGAIGTYTSPDYIELLRNKMVMQKAGATVISGLNQNLSIPRQSGASTAAWVGEGSATSASNQTVDNVLFQPAMLTCFTDISRQGLQTSSFDFEQFVMNDLAQVQAIKLDQTGLNGSGSGSEPTGIIGTSSIGSVVGGSNGAAPTFANMVQLESAVATANADIGKLAYIGSAKARGFLKLTPKVSGFPQYIYEQGEVNSYPFYATNSMPDTLTKGGSGAVCSAILFGNWADAVFALFGANDVIVDPYTGSSSGTLRVVMLQLAQFKVRHPQSFAAMLDALCT